MNAIELNDGVSNCVSSDTFIEEISPYGRNDGRFARKMEGAVLKVKNSNRKGRKVFSQRAG